MGEIAILLIGISLSMDAFAVSISNGVAAKRFGKKEMFMQATYFGAFQCIMPLIGWLLGSGVKDYIQAVDHWIAFVLLAIIGGNMIKESRSDEREEEINALTHKKLFVQALATSIDALAVGISFALLKVNILEACLMIGVVTFVISFGGSITGKYLGDKLQSKAEVVGGLVLILIGTKILIEHLFFGG